LGSAWRLSPRDRVQTHQRAFLGRCGASWRGVLRLPRGFALGAGSQERLS
jgi:hypothetical protein